MDGSERWPTMVPGGKRSVEGLPQLVACRVPSLIYLLSALEQMVRNEGYS